MMAEADKRLMTDETGRRIAAALEEGIYISTATTYNGLDQTEAGYALDARQGKALNEGKADMIISSASGAVASFSDGAAYNAEDVTLEIEPVQSGSGDPSPSNVRPISGWTGANVYVEPEYDAEADPAGTVSWQSTAGTVYGGTLDMTTGELTVTMASIDLGTLSWSARSNNRFEASLSTGGKAHTQNVMPQIICSIYEKDTYYNVYNGVNNKRISTYTDGMYVEVSDSSYSSASDFTTAMNGVQLVYELATSITYQLTPQDIALLLGDNNVWADTGDTSVQYRADTKLYIDNAIASAIAALNP